MDLHLQMSYRSVAWWNIQSKGGRFWKLLLQVLGADRATFKSRLCVYVFSCMTHGWVTITDNHWPQKSSSKKVVHIVGWVLDGNGDLSRAIHKSSTLSRAILVSHSLMQSITPPSQQCKTVICELLIFTNGKTFVQFYTFNGAFDLHLERGREYVKSGHSFRELIIEAGVHVLGGSFQYLFAFYYFLLLVYFSIPPLSSAMRKWLVSMKASFWKHNVLITTMWMKLAQWASFS